MKNSNLILKKIISFIVSGAILVSGIVISPMVNVQAEEGSGYGLKSPRVDVQTRETIYFGKYWSYYCNTDVHGNRIGDKEPIRWQILKKYDDGTALVLADDILDSKPFYDSDYDNDSEGTVSNKWEYSTVREWLNGNNPGDFMYEAFTTDEQTAIKTVDLVNEDNPVCGTDSGNDTEDKVFLLSFNEALDTFGYYWEPGKEWDWNSDNVSDESILAANGYDKNYGESGTWWLRTAGQTEKEAAGVYDCDGYVYCWGYFVDGGNGIRPAMRVDLASEFVQDGGEEIVKVKGTEWDSVIFGRYNDKNLTWRVLNVNGDDAFLLSNEVIDSHSYVSDDVAWKDHDDYNSSWSSWDSSDIREWLNNDFFDNAFSNEEKSIIRCTKVINDFDYDNYYNSDTHENNTIDRVFLLSQFDTINPAYGFSKWFDCDTDTRVTNYESYSDMWWLRNTGDAYPQIIDCYSGFGTSSYFIDEDNGGVRPAIHIKLSSGSWTKGSVITAGDYSNGVILPLDENRVCDTALDIFEIKHDYKEVEGTSQEATCEQEGKESDRKCVNCGDVIIGKKIKRLSHDMEYIKEKPSNCGEYGMESHYHCKLCDGLFIKDSESEEDDDYWKVSEDDLSIPPTDEHVWDKGKIIIEPTETMEGEVLFTCKVCGETYSDFISYEDRNKYTDQEEGKDDDNKQNPTNPTDPTSKTTDEKPTEATTEKKTEAPTVAPSKSDTVKTPAKVVIKKARNIKGKKLNVKWKKVSGAKGYQVQYSTNKKFKKAKTKTTKKTTLTIKKLKKKKTYFVRVRAYTIDASGKKVPGKWSKVKKVKIKK